MSQNREPIDTYLLRVLNTLLIERSVTRAAVKLNQSQPAISAALRRLRDITDDPLLVRGKSGMVPTEYGQSLLEPTQNALREIERITVQQSTFNPATTVRTFRIGSPDYLNVFFVPTVIERFRQQAPHAHLELHSLGPAFDYEHALEDGKVDIVIGNWPEPPEQLHLSNLFVDQIVCLMRDTHPYAKRGLTLEQYLKSPHLAPMPYSVAQRGTIDMHLARERLKRNVMVTIPYFNLAPYALLKSDLIFTTTQLFAEHYAEFLPLTVTPTPIDFPPMQYYQLWHERTHYSEEVRWLRGLISEATRTLLEQRTQS